MDYNPHNLSMGSKIKIGSVILEITQDCTICEHLSVIDIKLPRLLKNDRGVFAKVLKAGIIESNDSIYLI